MSKNSTKKIILLIILIVGSTFLNGCGVISKLRTIFKFGEQETFNYGVTAQQWLPSILQRAKEWKEDAYFYGITETPVNKDGASDKWIYLFYSPGSEKEANIIYEAGFISLKEVSMPPLNSIRNFNIDSPTALNIAKENGGSIFVQSNQNISIIMSLSGPRDGSTPKWLIKFYGDTKTLVYLVDASSGKLIQKSE